MIWFRDVSVQHNLEPFLYNMIQSHFSVIQRWFSLIWLRAVFDYWIFRYNMIQSVFSMIGLELFDTIWFRDILIWCDSEVFRSSLIQSHFKRIKFRTFLIQHNPELFWYMIQNHFYKNLIQSHFDIVWEPFKYDTIQSCTYKIWFRAVSIWYDSEPYW